MAFDFTGKRVGGAGGGPCIGRSLAPGVAQAGAAASTRARGQAGVEKVRAELTAFGHAAHAATCDLGDGGAVTRYIGEAAAALGGIDVLVNNASGFGLT